LFFEPLRTDHIETLLSVLRNQEVYQFIDGAAPTEVDFKTWLINAMAGPPSSRANEHWLNFVVGEVATQALIGRLEATVHGGLAEVALLFSPASWGKGFASEALGWIHQHIVTEYRVAEIWACTEPENERCRRLLERAGYVEVRDQSAMPWLASHSPGDVTYRYAVSRSAARRAAPGDAGSS
jgi:RimJ/RimL family protein N-acetyltransferase